MIYFDWNLKNGLECLIKSERNYRFLTWIHLKCTFFCYFKIYLLKPNRKFEEDIATHSVFLPRKSHGQRTLGGYSP